MSSVLRLERRNILVSRNGAFVFQDLPTLTTKFKPTLHYLLHMSLLVLTLFYNFKLKARLSQQQTFGLQARCICNVHTDTLFVVGYNTYPVITYGGKSESYVDT
jgi:hypothetical protein